MNLLIFYKLLKKLRLMNIKINLLEEGLNSYPLVCRRPADLFLEFDDSGQFSTKFYDKRDDFNFKIINLPNMCSNIPVSPAYGVYISQLIRYEGESFNSPGPVACFSDKDDVSEYQNNCYWPLHSESIERCKHHMQGTALTTILPILFQYCNTYCYSDSRNLWAVVKAGGLAL
jgi:hypothetical protein